MCTPTARACVACVSGAPWVRLARGHAPGCGCRGIYECAGMTIRALFTLMILVGAFASFFLARCGRV